MLLNLTIFHVYDFFFLFLIHIRHFLSQYFCSLWRLNDMKGILKQLEKQQRVMQTDLNFAFSDEDLAKSAFLLYSVWFF